ncbi:hypothetical protein CLV63_107161 [Murinocardiopsis flavida]|uniref:Uncharacterized protein n=1 Tax=Murinocardiopsis flavida TaxID=645275 RepID=A0A2P8DKN8_9ACTN|nr:hypothetical protein CLV63_107161 [Murinocardiopsis flavida]
MSMGRCPHCGWTDAHPFRTLSRHRTATGLTVWARCWCGSLQVRVIDEAGVRVAARGRPAEGAADPASTAPPFQPCP